MNLSIQAQNSLILYRGASVESIKKAFEIQHSSVVKELMDYCHADNEEMLATMLHLRMF